MCIYIQANCVEPSRNKVVVKVSASSSPPPSPSTTTNLRNKAPEQPASRASQCVEENDLQSPPQESSTSKSLRVAMVSSDHEAQTADRVQSIETSSK